MPHELNSARNNATIQSEHLRRVREAAEAIFRPKAPQPVPAGTTTQPTVAVREPDTHSPPISPAGQPMLAEATTLSSVGVHHPLTRAARLLPVEQQSRVVSETVREVKRTLEPNGIANSEHDRIRVLATYGMTVGQIAALYDVTLQTIETIVSRPKAGQRQQKAGSVRGVCD